MNKNNFGIYIHIPFCMSKCSYCSFISKCASEEEIAKYFEYLNKQIMQEAYKFKDKKVTSIYFGGGTPSFVDSKYIVDVLDLIKSLFCIAETCEISIECNPCSITLEKLKDYKNAGINRISFGIQSLSDDILPILGRKHKAKQALNAIRIAQDCGFDNISADLLIGIPNQTVEILKNDLRILINTGVKHISAYMLMLEENTKLYEQVVINKSLKVASDDECVNMYNDAYILLKKNGINRYEISNFSYPGFECKHNLNYWQCGEYVGFGLSAYSFYDNKRIDGFANFEDYYKNVDCGNPFPKTEKLSKEQKIEEYIMLGLRTADGVNLNTLKTLGYDILFERADLINLYIKNNIIRLENNRISICDNMFGASNQIIVDLLP